MAQRVPVHCERLCCCYSAAVLSIENCRSNFAALRNDLRTVYARVYICVQWKSAHLIYRRHRRRRHGRRLCRGCAATAARKRKRRPWEVIGIGRESRSGPMSALCRSHRAMANIIIKKKECKTKTRRVAYTHTHQGASGWWWDLDFFCSSLVRAGGAPSEKKKRKTGISCIRIKQANKRKRGKRKLVEDR